MNKQIPLIILITSCSTFFSQQIYSWINIPYAPGNMSEYQIDELFHMEDSVQAVKQYTGYGKFVSGVDLLAEFDLKGNMITYCNGQMDNMDPETMSSSFYDFRYDKNNKLIGVRYTDYDKGELLQKEEGLEFSIFNDTLPQPIKTNKNGNSLVFSYAGDTTYSLYDEYGRKILDSVPGTGQTMGHKLIYYYKSSDTIVVERVSFSKGKVDQITTYALDHRGNWIWKHEETLEPTLPFPIITYKRLITYYNEDL